MSDLLYDSLEEDATEDGDSDDKCTWGSLDSERKNFGHDSTYLREENDSEGQRILLRDEKSFDVYLTYRKSLTKIGPENGVKTVTVDDEVLKRQGLQLNEDGSFSKSPRLEFEQLPFVTREYRNLLFQKKKTYRLNKKSSSNNKYTKTKITTNGIKEKISNKLIASEIDNDKKVSSDDTSLNRLKKESAKGLLNNNLTDAMKEKLLLKHIENSPRKKYDAPNQLKKGKPTTIFMDSSRTEKTLLGEKIAGMGSASKVPVVSNGSKYFKAKTRMDGKGNEWRCAETKPGWPKVFRNHSDISLNYFKPQLSYMERRQKEFGFNPLCLRHNFHKCLSETNRSNFGDSVASELPEISSRALSTGKINKDDQEEEFYRRLMEKDKLAQGSTRSEAQFKSKKLMDLSVSNSFKNQIEFKYSKKRIDVSKKSNKLIAIDIPEEVKPLPCSLKKNCHYCFQASSLAATKAELALKARAYGFMVNARNVFKLKNQSGDKPVGKNSLHKPVENPGRILGQQKNRRNEWAVSSESKQEFIVGLENGSSIQEVEKQRPKTEFHGGSVKREESFFLPRFEREPGKEGEFANQILQQMKYCLDQDISYQNLTKRYGAKKNLGRILPV